MIIFKEIERSELINWFKDKGDAVIGSASYSDESPIVAYLIETYGSPMPMFWTASPTSVGYYGNRYLPETWLANLIRWIYVADGAITGNMCLEALNEHDN